jgi:hypothetical protein
MSQKFPNNKRPINKLTNPLPEYLQIKTLQRKNILPRTEFFFGFGFLYPLYNCKSFIAIFFPKYESLQTNISNYIKKPPLQPSASAHKKTPYPTYYLTPNTTPLKNSEQSP